MFVGSYLSLDSREVENLWVINPGKTTLPPLLSQERAPNNQSRKIEIIQLELIKDEKGTGTN